MKTNAMQPMDGPIHVWAAVNTETHDVDLDDILADEDQQIHLDDPWVWSRFTLVYTPKPSHTTCSTSCGHTFGEALEAMATGQMAYRECWPDDSFVFKQVPSEVMASYIPSMRSLPQEVKSELGFRGLNLRYQDQFALVCPASTIRGWSPSPSDCLGLDWCITVRKTDKMV